MANAPSLGPSRLRAVSARRSRRGDRSGDRISCGSSSALGAALRRASTAPQTTDRGVPHVTRVTSRGSLTTRRRGFLGESSKQAADQVHLTGGPPSSCNRRRSSQTASSSSGQIASPSSKSSSVATRTQQAIGLDVSGSHGLAAAEASRLFHLLLAVARRRLSVLNASDMYSPTVLQRRTDW